MEIPKNTWIPKSIYMPGDSSLSKPDLFKLENGEIILNNEKGFNIQGIFQCKNNKESLVKYWMILSDPKGE